MEMKNVLTIILLVILFQALCIFTGWTENDSESIKQKIDNIWNPNQYILSFEDSANDSSDFVLNEPKHDLVKTEVYVDSEFINFKFYFLKSFKEIVIKDGIGWSTTTVNVFIDTDNNISTGKKYTSVENNKNNESLNGWDIKLSGMSGFKGGNTPDIIPAFKAFSHKSKFSHEILKRNGETIEYFINKSPWRKNRPIYVWHDKNTIVFRLPKNDIGSRSDKIKVYITDDGNFAFLNHNIEDTDPTIFEVNIGEKGKDGV